MFLFFFFYKYSFKLPHKVIMVSADVLLYYTFRFFINFFYRHFLKAWSSITFIIPFVTIRNIADFSKLQLLKIDEEFQNPFCVVVLQISKISILKNAPVVLRLILHEPCLEQKKISSLRTDIKRCLPW